MTGDGLRPDDVARIADAVEDVERTIARMREIRDLTREEYAAPENLETREAVERKFVKLTAATIDVGETIHRAERGSVPESRKEVVTGLRECGVIDDQLTRRLHEAVGFRDVLAHSYGPVVNDDIVYDALQHSLGRYVEFVEVVDEYLQDADSVS